MTRFGSEQRTLIRTWEDEFERSDILDSLRIDVLFQLFRSERRSREYDGW